MASKNDGVLDQLIEEKKKILAELEKKIIDGQHAVSCKSCPFPGATEAKPVPELKVPEKVVQKNPAQSPLVLSPLSEAFGVPDGKTELSTASTIDPGNQNTESLIVLVSPRRGSLSTQEKAILSKHFSLFEYNPAIHENKDILSVPKGTCIIVKMGDSASLRWFGHNVKKIAHICKAVLMLSHREKSETYLEKKHIFHVQSIVKDLPPLHFDRDAFVQAILSDVVPSLPTFWQAVGKGLAKFFLS